jgi:Tfp pilus assembly protein PilX
MPPIHPGVFSTRQTGSTLIISMILLVIVMMLGITAMVTSNTQFKLSGNLQFEDSAMNNAETAVTTAENWLSTGTNYSNAGFTTYSAGTAQLHPISHLAGLAPPANDPLTMTWSDGNSVMVNANSQQRYLIELISRNSRLLGSSPIVGGRTSTACNQVNTYQITGRGLSARGATKYVQSYYSVLSC